MTQTDRYFIGPGLRSKLRDVIRRVDGEAYALGSGEIPTRLQGEGGRGGGGGASIRFGQFSGSWPKGQTKTVIRLNGDGTAVSPEETFTAKNWFSDISVDCGTRKVACAKVGDTWILIQAEC